MKKVLDDWYARVDAAQRAHYISADRLKNRSYWLGVPAAILSLFVGTSVFAALQMKTSSSWQVFVGICSVSAAVLAGLQTFLVTLSALRNTGWPQPSTVPLAVS